MYETLIGKICLRVEHYSVGTKLMLKNDLS